MDNIRRLSVFSILSVLLLAGCSQPADESETDSTKAIATTKPAPVSTPIEPVTAAMQTTTSKSSTSTSTSTSSSSSSSRTTTSSSSTRTTSTSSTSTTGEYVLVSTSTAPTTSTIPLRELSLSLSSDKPDYYPGSTMVLTVQAYSTYDKGKVMANVYGIEVRSKYILNLEQTYSIRQGANDIRFEYKVPECTEEFCVPAKKYAVYADITASGNIIANAETQVQIYDTPPEGVKIDAGLKSDNSSYAPGDVIQLAVSAGASAEVRQVQLHVYGISSSGGNRIDFTEYADLKAGNNAFKFSYTVPNCPSCSRIKAGIYTISLDLFVDGRIVAKSSAKVAITEEDG